MVLLLIPGSGGPGAGSPTGVVQEVVLGSRRPRWLTSTLRDADSGVPPRTYVRESTPPKRFCSYVALVTSIVDLERGSFDEASAQQVWRDAMVEEYLLNFYQYFFIKMTFTCIVTH